MDLKACETIVVSAKFRDCRLLFFSGAAISFEHPISNRECRATSHKKFDFREGINLYDSLTIGHSNL
jgi:hypothetical protein